jgi:hypothetical protein
LSQPKQLPQGGREQFGGGHDALAAAAVESHLEHVKPFGSELSPPMSYAAGGPAAWPEGIEVRAFRPCSPRWRRRTLD